MGTGAFDEFMNWAIYKLKDKDDSILIGVMFCLMVYLGAFGGSDALIAIVPIGVMFAKKLKLDPICAMGVSTYATLIGFGTGPTKQATTQMLMGVQISRHLLYHVHLHEYLYAGWSVLPAALCQEDPQGPHSLPHVERGLASR